MKNLIKNVSICIMSLCSIMSHPVHIDTLNQLLVQQNTKHQIQKAAESLTSFIELINTLPSANNSSLNTDELARVGQFLKNGLDPNYCHDNKPLLIILAQKTDFVCSYTELEKIIVLCRVRGLKPESNTKTVCHLFELINEEDDSSTIIYYLNLIACLQPKSSMMHPCKKNLTIKLNEFFASLGHNPVGDYELLETAAATAVRLGADQKTVSDALKKTSWFCSII